MEEINLRYASLFIHKPSDLAQAVTLLIYVRKVSGSNLNQFNEEW
jgi:hypothetical protein